MKVKGKNVVVYFNSVISITSSIVDNGNGTQTVTFVWTGVPPNTTAVTLGYNDGTWHDSTGGFTSPRSITIPVGSYTYRFIFVFLGVGLTSGDLTPPAMYDVRTTYACALSVSLDLETEFIETSVSGTGTFATFLPTKNSFTGTLEGLTSLEEPDMLTLADLRQKQINQELLSMEYELTDSGGNIYSEEASFYISSSSFSGSFNDMSHFSVGLRGTGILTIGGES